MKNISSNAETAGITITGGEPLLREDLPEIISICVKHKLKVAVATNGYLLAEKLASNLVKEGVEHFDIGFSHPTPKAKAAIITAAKTKKTVTASICINQLNYKKIKTTIRIASALGANAVALNQFIPTGLGKENATKLQLTNTQLIEALQAANEAAEISGIYCYTGIPIEPCQRKNNSFPFIHFSTCQCGNGKWAIDPWGNLRTCEQNKNILGSLLKDSFNTITNNHHKAIKQFTSWRPSANCTICTIEEQCFGGCRFR